METADCEIDQGVAQITHDDEYVIARIGPVGRPGHISIHCIDRDQNRRCPGDVSLGIKTGLFDHAAKEGIERRPF